MNFSLIILFGVVTSCLSYVKNPQGDVKFYEEKNYHDPKKLTNEEVLHLANLTDMKHFKAVLEKILVTRVVGTPNHLQVGNYIVDQMKNLGWDVQEDLFTDYTPVFGDLNFRNIIARLNPNADRYLVLACHYDSKYTVDHKFVGATDSAVPCAMMINLAKTMASELQPHNSSGLSLMFIFFDGEEAFSHWSAKDSIYGARHLAQLWESQPYKDGANQLQRMDVMVLLDLLGAPDPHFYSYFSETEKWYVTLAEAEERLANLNQFRGYSRGKVEQTYFRMRSSRAHIEDDHIPFLQRNISIVHIITDPFPPFWHSPDDNYDALDFNVTENLATILRVFVAQYLNGTRGDDHRYMLTTLIDKDYVSNPNSATVLRICIPCWLAIYVAVSCLLDLRISIYKVFTHGFW